MVVPIKIIVMLSNIDKHSFTETTITLSELLFQFNVSVDLNLLTLFILESK